MTISHCFWGLGHFGARPKAAWHGVSGTSEGWAVTRGKSGRVSGKSLGNLGKSMFLCLKIGHAIQNSILIGNMMVNDWILRIFQKNPYFFWGGEVVGGGKNLRKTRWVVPRRKNMTRNYRLKSSVGAAHWWGGGKLQYDAVVDVGQNWGHKTYDFPMWRHEHPAILARWFIERLTYVNLQ